LAYLIVIPVILVIAPKLQGLIAKLFISMKGTHAGAGGTRALQQRIAFALIMGAITTGVISFAVLLSEASCSEPEPAVGGRQVPANCCRSQPAALSGPNRALTQRSFDPCKLLCGATTASAPR
jgi:hypothetical protein